ncbi:hypothetical protein CSV68_07340 [Sporosarcina sp. P29]|nr:hypothetical protein CSV68_07340 [Sporosarcina sp. P29]
MFLYFTLFSVFIFSIVISAVVGFLFHELSNKLVSFKVFRLIVGAGVSVLVSGFLTKLLRIDIGYMYIAAIVMSVVLYVILVRSLNKSEK